MNAGESTAPDSNRQALHVRLQSADTALRTALNQPCAETLVRAHIERALAHISEAETALHNLTRARTVEQLAEQLARIEEMGEELRSQEIAITTPSIRI